MQSGVSLKKSYSKIIEFCLFIVQYYPELEMLWIHYALDTEDLHEQAYLADHLLAKEETTPLNNTPVSKERENLYLGTLRTEYLDADGGSN